MWRHVMTLLMSHNRMMDENQGENRCADIFVTLRLNLVCIEVLSSDLVPTEAMNGSTFY